MEGWIVKIEADAAPKCCFVLSGVTVCSPKLRDALKGPEAAPLVYVTQYVSEYDMGKSAKDGNFFVFEDEGEAKDFLGLLKRFQTLNEIICWETSKTSKGFRHLELSLQKISAKKIMYADFDQIMESFDGFEERMEKAAKKLA
jgi:hypothetical protein